MNPGLNSLLFAILSSAAIFIVFKASEKYSKDALVLICYNYLAAFSLAFTANIGTREGFEIDSKMILPAIITGGLFIAVFFIISLSSKFAGVARTTLASKMSFGVPVIFSVLYFGEHLNIAKIIGFVLALLSVFMVVYKPENKSIMTKGVIYPIILFIGAGMVDSAIKFIQQTYLTKGGEHIFSTIVFGVAFLISLLVVISRGGIKRLLTLNRIIGGVVLGIANYGSLYFLIKTLNSGFFESSVVFCLISIGIVLFNIVIGIYIFGERISLFNKVGILLALIAILTLTLL